jgi:hypothetical protein
MNWALVFLTCVRMCQPQYVELYQTKEECMKQVDPKLFQTTTTYCVPVARK